MRNLAICGLLAATSFLAAAPASASVYLNGANGVTVAVGPGTSVGSPNNTYDYGFGIEKVIDAPTAAAEEVHSQPSHIWYSFDDNAGGLELLFDLGLEYDISTLHFWNYNAEGFDVDEIDFSFFNGLNNSVGTLTINPTLGSPGGIDAQDIVLPAPLNVRYVTAFLTGTNGEVDFQNMGFTAEISVPGGVPEPATWAMMLLGFGAVGAAMRRKKQAEVRFRIA